MWVGNLLANSYIQVGEFNAFDCRIKTMTEDHHRHYGIEDLRVVLSSVIVAHHAGMPYGRAGVCWG